VEQGMSKKSIEHDLLGRSYDPGAKRDVFGRAVGRDSWECQRNRDKKKIRELEGRLANAYY
jgi:hypothetical protein